MKTAAKSEDALRSKGAGAEFGKMFKGFELYSIYFTSAIGGAVAGGFIWGRTLEGSSGHTLETSSGLLSAASWESCAACPY